MKYNSEKHHRRSIRLSEYDYSNAGAYFVTICVKDRQTILGRIENGTLRISEFGGLVRDAWLNLPEHYDNVVLDEYVIMPNHVHGIIFLQRRPRNVGAGFKPARNHRLSEIVRSFKTFSAQRINRIRRSDGASFWQRNYYERIIRNEKELNRIRQYIIDNPVRWDTDRNNPNVQFSANRGPMSWEES